MALGVNKWRDIALRSSDFEAPGPFLADAKKRSRRFKPLHGEIIL